jgi:phage shock protein A
MTDPLSTLRNADEACRETEAAVAEHGEERVEAVADAHERATNLLDRYESRATGTGDFQAFVEFQGTFADLVENLPDDLPARKAFERAEDAIDKRRLNERDFEKARASLEPAATVAALLDERRAARERYRDARHSVSRKITELDERIAHLERLQELGDADLDAPTEELREPVETSDEAITDAFRAFKRKASAREVVAFLAATERYPLVGFESPPDDLRDYLRESDAGSKSIPDLLEFARYSRSKLDHYVPNPDALKRTVATNETYLDRLDADPLTVGWPPAPADELRWWCEEAIRVADRFAPPDAVARLREVQRLTYEPTRFERLRTAAQARAELTDDERDRLARGAVEDELRRARERKAELADALSDRPER